MMGGQRAAASLRTGIGLGLAALAVTVYGAVSNLHGEIDRVLTSDSTGSVCMVRLADWPADTGLQCPGRWLAFRCTAKAPGGGHARRMFDSVREALADGQPVGLRVTDDERVGQFCVVTRISVPGSSGDEEDSDGDGVADLEDDVPLNASETVDSDDDGQGDHADPDDDNDGVGDLEDAFPFDPLETVDTDGGGLGDNADADDDNDGVPDSEDAFPLDPSEWADADRDGIGDNADPSTGGFALLDGASLPGWIVLVEGTFHIVTANIVSASRAGKVYAYGPTGERRRFAEFALDPANTHPSGIAFGRGLFFVLDYFERKIFAYERSGVRRPASDVSLLPDGDDGSPAGLAFADDVLYVGLAPSVHAYAVSGQRDPQADLDLLGALDRVDSVQGMTYSNSTDTLYVQVATGHAENTVLAFPRDGEPYVFRLPYSDRTSLEGLATDAGKLFVGVDWYREAQQGIRAFVEPTKDDGTVEAVDAENLQLAPANLAPAGVAYADGKFYVVDEAVGRVFVYRADGAYDQASSFALDLPCRARDRSTCWVDEIHGITSANDRLFIAMEFQHERRHQGGGSYSYSQHVRAFTFQGVRDAVLDFDVTPAISHWMHGITFAEGRFYVLGLDRVFVHSASGERMAEHEFSFDVSRNGSSSGGIAFGNDTLYLYTSNDAFEGVRAYTLGGERRRSLDLEAWGSGLTVAGDVVHAVSGGRVHAYPTQSAECQRPAALGGPLANATVEILQGPLVSVRKATDCGSTEYSPAVSGRGAAVVLSVEHSHPEMQDVSVRVGSVGVAATMRETRSTETGTWNTSSTYLVDGTLFRDGSLVSFETGRVVDHDSDYADGFDVPIKAASLAPLRVTFVPIRTPDDLAPVVEPAAYMEAIRDFFPVGGYRATVGPVLNLKYSGTFTPRSAAQELSRRWYREADADEFYHGIFRFSAGRCGYALISSPVAVSAALGSSRFNPCPNIHAHEIGHNFGLDHSDCGGTSDVDPRYPYPNAGIGPRRGWLLSERRFIEPDSGYYDVMSYCRPNFISDYHYDKAFAHLQRLGTPPLSHADPMESEPGESSSQHRLNAPPLDGAPEAGDGSADTSSTRTIVLTGIVSAGGRFSGLRVETSTKPALPPPAEGSFTLAVLDAQRVQLHTQRLAVHADEDGRLSVWGARFAVDGTPRFVVVRDGEGAVVFEKAMDEAISVLR